MGALSEFGGGGGAASTGSSAIGGKKPTPGRGGVVLSASPEESRVRAISEIVRAMIDGVRAGRDVNLNAIKSDASRKHGLSRAPKLVEIIAAVPEEHRDALIPRLRAKPVRTASGIAVVAVMSKPHRCPHIATTGNICVYCPGGPDSDFEYSTQSYTGYEPTSMRAIRASHLAENILTGGTFMSLPADYNCKGQNSPCNNPLSSITYHYPPLQVEYILMGGTFMSLPADYRDFFVRNLHDALSGRSSASVAEAVQYAEHAATRCIGLTIETALPLVASLSLPILAGTSPEADSSVQVHAACNRPLIPNPANPPRLLSSRPCLPSTHQPTSRPDYCLGPHLRQMLAYGCTRLEIGVQSTYEDVARDTNRGHTVAAVADCFCLAKDAGFKVVAHMMLDLPNVGMERDVGSPFPGPSKPHSLASHFPIPHPQVVAHMMPDLPNVGMERDMESLREFMRRGGAHDAGSTQRGHGEGHGVTQGVVAHMMPDLPNVGMERDMESFREFMHNPAFRTDGLKLYPTLVIRGTGLYELWKTGRYRNYPPEKLIDLVARILALVPPWTRVYRIMRDIPLPLVTSGIDKGNLRELALARMAELGLRCRDVRTREAGIQDIHHAVRPHDVQLVRRDYAANDGWETFLSYEDVTQDILVGLLRLRRCGAHVTCPELRGRCSIVRELHVYGTAVPVHTRDTDKLQHQASG
ncbi:unnamed protein product [Closterium sp. NIES-53]